MSIVSRFNFCYTLSKRESNINWIMYLLILTTGYLENSVSQGLKSMSKHTHRGCSPVPRPGGIMIAI